MKAYVFTTGEFHRVLVDKILPPKWRPQVSIKDGGAQSSVLSLGKSILILRRLPVAVFLDAGTNDPDEEQLKKLSLRDALSLPPRTAGFEIVLARPRVEALLFFRPATLRTLIGSSLAPELETLSKIDPRRALQRLLGPGYQLHLMQRLAVTEIPEIREHPAALQLCRFLSKSTGLAPA